MVTACVDTTANVVIVNVAVVWPWATTTSEGTCAVKRELVLSWTMNPPDVAGPARVMVPVALVPPVTVVGATVRLCNVPPPAD